MKFTGERFIPGVAGNIYLEHFHRYHFCIDFIAGKDVLDIACGEGYGSAMISAHARKVWGVDISAQAISHAQSEYKAGNLQFLLGSCTAIPLPDTCVDIAVSFETIEHLTEHDEMMLELRRVLRPNGALIISSPDKRIYSDERNFKNSFHLRELYAEEFKALLQKNFEHVVIYGQRIVFGSAIMRQSGQGKLSSIGIDGTQFSEGLDNPIYQIAVASNSIDWTSKGFSGLMEDSIFRSEAAIEKASVILNLEAEIDNMKRGKLVANQASVEMTQLTGQISSFASAVSDLPKQISDLTLQVSELPNHILDMSSGKLIAHQASAEMNNLIGHISRFTSTISHLPKQMFDLPSQISDLSIQVSRLTEQVSFVTNHVANLTFHLTQPAPPAPPIKRSQFSKLGFHASGKPRGWLRFLLLRDRKIGTPRRPAIRLLFKRNGKVRPVFRDWYGRYDISPENEVLYNYAQMLRDQLAQGDLAKAKTVCLVSTQHTAFIAEAVSMALAETRLQVSHVTEMPRDFIHDLYIVIAAQMFDCMPPPERCFLFQMEQVRASRWVDTAYLERMRPCLGILDYAFDNITALIERGLPLKQLFYVPIQPIAMPKVLSQKRDIDVLFYGAQGSARRDRYLAALSKRVNIRVENNLFGAHMADLISRAKVVVNIHYFENALLETTRLSEALSHGAFVVSEQSADQAHQTDFDGLVDFVAPNDVESFVRQVEKRLQEWTCPPVVRPREDVGSMKFLLLRALHGCGVLSFEEFSKATETTDLPSDSLVLGLPEEAPRRLSAQQNRLPGFAAFPALRHVDGWKGCAQSYKYMASKAKNADIPQLKICEDDAVFAPGTAKRLAVIAEYLDQQNSSWDVFSGILTDLSEDAKISAVIPYDSEKFVHLNSVIGMVFGIYNRSAIETLATFEFGGADTRYHTIDRYLESKKPRCITTVPAIAMQGNDFESTLWPAHNKDMTNMISASLSRLEKKVKAFNDGSRL